MYRWTRTSWQDILENFNTSLNKGLTEEQAKENKKLYGENSIYEIKPSYYINIFKKLFLNGFSFMSICFIIFTIYLGHYIMSTIGIGVFWAYIIFNINPYLGMIRALINLKNSKGKKVSVIRNGANKTIDYAELVAGDIISLRSGAIIPADIRVIEDEDLWVGEGNITGFDGLIKKQPVRIEDDNIELKAMTNMLFDGTYIEKGYSLGVVVAVGKSTHLGKSLLALESQWSYENSVDSMSKFYWLIFIMNVATILVFYKDNFSALPIVLISITNLSFILIMLGNILWSIFYKLRLKKKSIFIKGMSWVKKLIECNTIVMDKPGSISEDICYIDGFYTDGNYIEAFNKVDFKNENLNRLMSILYLTIQNNNMSPEDVAINKFMENKQIEDYFIEKAFPRVFEIPWSNEGNMITRVNRIDSNYRAHIRGEAQEILSKCTHIMKNGAEIEIKAEDISAIKEKDMEMIKKGHKVMVLAYRNFTYQPSLKENILSNLVFVGLIEFNIPLKDNIEEDINSCYRYHMTPVIFCDDNKLGAVNLGKSLGIVSNHETVLAGSELNYMIHEEFENNVDKMRIFCRLSKMQREGTIEKLKEKGFKILGGVTDRALFPSLKNYEVPVYLGNQHKGAIERFLHISIEDNYLKNILELLNRSLYSDKAEKWRCKFSICYGILSFLALAMIYKNPFSNYMIILALGNLIQVPLLIFAIDDNGENEKVCKVIIWFYVGIALALSLYGYFSFGISKALIMLVWQILIFAIYLKTKL